MSVLEEKKSPRGVVDDIASDIALDHWTIRMAPASAVPYLKLARVDRPIGTWLLLLPCLWSMVLAQISTGHFDGRQSLYFTLLFAIGALFMRGAGCTLNDMADRDFDKQVARTAQRPLASGALSLRQATLFLGFQLSVGLVILVQFNFMTIAIAAGSLLLVAAYPFMKRITYWPQAWLGLTFNWGALVGWVAITSELDWPALTLYAGGVFWTLGYDTIYAHQDKHDDEVVGLKSTALKLGRHTRRALCFLYSLALLLFGGAALMVGAAPGFAAMALTLPAVHFIWQIKRLEIDDSTQCLKLFKSNAGLGVLWLLGLIFLAFTSNP